MQPCDAPARAPPLWGEWLRKARGERVRSRKEARRKAGDAVTVITGGPGVINPKAPIRSFLVTCQASPQVSLYDTPPFLPRRTGTSEHGPKDLISCRRSPSPAFFHPTGFRAIKDLDEKPCPNLSKDRTDGRATPSRPSVSGVHPGSRRRPGQPPCCRRRPYQDFARREARVPSASSKADQTAPQPYRQREASGAEEEGCQLVWGFGSWGALIL